MPRSPSHASPARWLRADGALARAGHLFVLAGLAVVQPLWTLLGGNAEFFLARNADRAEILLAAAFLLVVPPAVAVAVVLLVAKVAGERAGSLVHGAAVAGFAALVFSRLFARAIGRPGWLVVGLALGCGAAVAAYYATTRGARLVLTVLTPMPLALLALFVLGSEVRPLVLPAADQATVRVEIPRRPPVVFLVFDEFPGTSYLTRTMEIDPHRAPNLARFARTATWYRNASTVHEVSEMAIPAILTGNRVREKKLPTAANFPLNLFSVFTAAGYRVSAAESLTRLCTAATCGSLPRRGPLLGRVKAQLSDLAVVYGHDVLPADLARRLPDISLTWGNFRGGGAGAGGDREEEVGPGGVRADIDMRQGPRFDRFVASLAPAGEPVLHYFHGLVPHAPFDHLPNGEEYPGRSFLGIDSRTGYWHDDPFFAEQALQRNLLQVGYADWQFGRIVRRLEEVGLFDEALVVLVGDHGSSNRPGVNRRAFAPTTLGDVGSVPMFVKLPGQRQGSVDDRSAETTDLLPTIAGGLDFALPADVDGHDLTDPSWRPERKVFTNQFGKDFVVPADFPQRRESVERIYRLFAHDGERLNLFAMGPYKSLVGTAVRRYPVRREGLRARLDVPAYWRTGAPPGWSPTRATGRLLGLPRGAAPGTPTHLLVAVGDRVVATSRSYDARGTESALSIFVPDDALDPGHPPVRLFAVTGGAATPALVEVSWS